MRTIHILLGILVAILLGKLTATAEPDSVKTVRTIERTIKVTDDGKVIKKTVVDGKEVSEEEFEKLPGKHRKIMVIDDDAITNEFGIDHPNHESWDWENEGGSKHIMVFRSPKHSKKFELHAPEAEQPDRFMILKDKSDIPGAPALRHNRLENRNGINLNDPDIISFQRETMKDGNEKITIIRKKNTEVNK